MFEPCWDLVPRVVVFKGGGGGGSAGKVEFPTFIETALSSWMDHTNTDTPDNSLIDSLNAAQTGDPYGSAVPHDPDADITAMFAELASYDTQVGLLLSATGLDTLMSDILSDSWVDDEVDAFSDKLDAQLVAEVYPRFEAGMRDINAVVSSAFAIGRSLIEDGRVRESAQFQAQLKGSTKLSGAMNLIQLTLSEYRALSHMTAEMTRLKTDWLTHETEKAYEYDDLAYRWPLDMWLYAGNLMASPSGASSYIPDKGQKIGKTQAAMSGAMAGASMGTAVSPGYGTAIGAVIGGIAGYMAA